MRRALLIVGKAPRAGRTKTRLVPPLSPDAAAALYRGFLLDSLSLGLELGWERLTVVHPRGSGHALVNLVPPTVCLFEQPADGLQDALTAAFEAHLAAGFDRVVLIGSDNPTLPRRALDAACMALATHDLAIGPSTDGGFYLLGLRQPHAALFESIEWSTPRVYAQIRANADALGLGVATVDMWYDVDEPADLDHLQHELQMLPPTIAAHTRVALEQIVLPALPH
jgi:hypothetical protein